MKTPETHWFGPILLPQRSQGGRPWCASRNEPATTGRYRDPLGRQRSETFTRKADAERYLREVQVEMDRGRWLDPAGADMALATRAEEFLSLARRLSPLTEEAYRRDIDKYVLPRFGAYRIGRLPADQIENWLNDEVAAGLAASSVHRQYRTLRRMLQVAVGKERILANPCERVQPPRAPPGDGLPRQSPATLAAPPVTDAPPVDPSTKVCRLSKFPFPPRPSKSPYVVSDFDWRTPCLAPTTRPRPASESPNSPPGCTSPNATSDALSRTPHPVPQDSAAASDSSPPKSPPGSTTTGTKPTPPAVAAETLHLFDPEPASWPEPSRSETPSRMSRNQTPATPSHSEASPVGTEASPARRPSTRGRRQRCLAASAAAAELDPAIVAARANGQLRTIAMATSIPHQTLHRRARQDRGTR